LILATACKNDKSTATDSLPTLDLDKNQIITHLTELSSDAYEGRRPFTAGETKTINYIADEFKKIGLLPANDGSYFQDVPLVEITGTPSDEMILATPGGLSVLENQKDFVLHTQRASDKLSLSDSPLVFCGYGTVDEARNWNDYAGMDMKGKTAVVLVNDPGFGGEDATFFNGDIMTYSGRWTYKYEEADRQGADGLIMIHETNMAGYPWFVIQSSWAGTMLEIERKADADDCGLKGWISLDQARALFASCNLDFTEQLKRARKPGFTPVELKATVTASLGNEVKKDITKNVIGYIEGAKYPDEYIIYTAHWDHLGIGKAIEGDSIYNGALDNATGTATILAIAKAFANAETKPDRSIVFAMVTAEEQGLLGSQYYCEHPLFPIDKTVANINMDGVNPMGIMKDVTAIGHGQSDIDKVLEEEAKKQGRYVLPDQNPEKGYYFRSDHFNFAKVGVPAIYAGGRVDHKEKGKAYAKEFMDTYTATYYHQPSDEYDPDTWNFDGMLQDGQLYLNLGINLAYSRFWPSWNADSEFKRAE
jgi:Zn-dependent M28 family amino/carboxypeptidase